MSVMLAQEQTQETQPAQHADAAVGPGPVESPARTLLGQIVAEFGGAPEQIADGILAHPAQEETLLGETSGMFGNATAAKVGQAVQAKKQQVQAPPAEKKEAPPAAAEDAPKD